MSRRPRLKSLPIYEMLSNPIRFVEYWRSFERYIRECSYSDVHPLVAFSGTVRDPDTGEELPNRV